MVGLNSVVEQIGSESVSRVRKKIMWSDVLRQLKKQSIDKHVLWKMMGKPRDGVINKERLRVRVFTKAAS